MSTSTVQATIRRRLTASDLLIRYRTVVILLLLIATFTILKNVFILPANLLNMLKRMSFVAITAFGMTFVITLGGLDLSVGGTAAIVGVGFALMLGAGIPAVLALLLCFLIAVALGAINGVIIVKGRIEPFLVTLATMNIFRGAALMATGGRPVPIVSERFITIFGNGSLFGIIPYPVLITAVFFTISLLLYKETKFGFFVRAIGGNIETARVAGINIQSIKLLTYIINAVFAFFAGLILAALMSSGLPSIAQDLPLDAISAVILGGTAIAGGFGNVLGTLGGALIMSTLNSGMSLLGAQYPVQIFVKGVVIIFAVLLDNMIRPRN
jgi:ribose transport system permease protein